MNFIERTVASCYPARQNIDPENIQIAIKETIRLIQSSVSGAMDGRDLMASLEDSDCLLSVGDCARMFHWAYRKNILLRQPSATGFSYSLNVKNTKKPLLLESLIGEVIDSMTAPSSQHLRDVFSSFETAEDMHQWIADHLPSGFKNRPLDIAADAVFKVKIPALVMWKSSNGSGNKMRGITLARVKGGMSSYDLIPEGTPRRRYRENFKDVSEHDRYLVYSVEKEKFYTPAAHIVVEEVIRAASESIVLPVSEERAERPFFPTGEKQEESRQLAQDLTFEALYAKACDEYGDQDDFPLETLHRLVRAACIEILDEPLSVRAAA